MAASSGGDIRAQLAAVLGYTIKRLRITDEVPPRISVIDLAASITQKDANPAAEQVAHVKNTQMSQIFSVTSSSADKGKKRTDVASARTTEVYPFWINFGVALFDGVGCGADPPV